MEINELQKECDNIDLTVTPVMAAAVEKDIVDQYKSNLWYKFRAGRVTASKMKSVCHTSPLNPSKSLIRNICYPEAFVFSSAATSWGCRQEKAAKTLYMKFMQCKHTNLVFKDSGLVINPLWPFIAASPDGVISCTCCGKGVFEIKCPYSHKGECITNIATHDSQFCLKKDSDGKLHLDHNHAYYYQVQTQLYVCNVDYCDFIVCTFSSKDGLYVERITKDNTFWNECVQKAELLFHKCILPELLGNWYTRSSISSHAIDVTTCSATDATTSSAENTSMPETSDSYYCYCRGPDEGEMIGCDNPQCPIQWFHFECLEITTALFGKWYCPDCISMSELKQSKKRKCTTQVTVS